MKKTITILGSTGSVGVNALRVIREHPEDFLDRRSLDVDGIDVATKDYLAGMTDRYAVGLFERLFIPRPWVGL